MSEYICKHCGINAEQMHATLRRAGEKYQTALRTREQEFAERCALHNRINLVTDKMKSAVKSADGWGCEIWQVQQWIDELTGKEKTND